MEKTKKQSPVFFRRHKTRVLPTNRKLSIIIDCYGFLSFVIDFCQSIKIDNLFFCEFDCDRLPISIDINRRLISIDSDYTNTRNSM